MDYSIAEIPQIQFEIGLRHLILISILSIPVGPILLFVVVRLLNFKLPGIYEIFEIWILSLVGGYIQWFIVLHRIYNWIIGKRHKVR